MKALSLKQPYAELVAIGLKTIELRKWNTKFRGKFLIHASKSKPNLLDCQTFGVNKFNLSFGELIGTAELVNVKDYSKLSDEQWQNDYPKHLAGEQYRTSLKGFILKNPMKFAYPIPYKGRLNFFEVPDSFLKQIWNKSLN